MSWADAEIVYKCSTLRRTPRAVLAYVGHRTNAESGLARVGAERVAAELGLSLRAVRDALAALVRSGELVIVEAGGGRGRASTYGLSPALRERNNAPGAPNGGNGNGAAGAGNGAENDGKRCTPCTPTEQNRTVTRRPPPPPPRGGGGALRGGAVAAAAAPEPCPDPTRAPAAETPSAPAMPCHEPAANTDPEATAFLTRLAERRADAARKSGARGAQPLAPSAGALLRAAGIRAPAGCTGDGAGNKPARRTRRIADAEQARTYAILRGVPGLADADARDLARRGTFAEFEAALGLPGLATAKNPGGFLAAAVANGWAAAGGGA